MTKTVTWALLPVKEPAKSKTRLLSVLQPEECAALSRAMFLDVLEALTRAAGIDKVAVLTNDAEVAATATELGHVVLADSAPGDMCAGLNEAVRDIAQRGAHTVFVIPGDMPTITAEDVGKLLARHTDGLSLCPAIRDGGTNAIVCSPPDAMPFQFGQDSARRHLEIAEQQGINAERIPMQAFFRDIDIPEDLMWLSSQLQDSYTRAFLQQSGIFARLGPALNSGNAA